MRFNLLPLSVTIALVISGNAVAADARSIALGGSNISNGIGVHGTLENPATLMRLKNDGDKVHLHLGASADVRDSAGLVQLGEDNDTLTDDFDNAVDVLDGQNILCNPVTGTPDNVCLQNTAPLGNVAQRFLNVLDTLDGSEVDAHAAIDFGFASTATPIPFAVHLRASTTGLVAPNIGGSAEAYATEFVNILGDDELTLGEIDNSNYIEVDPTNPAIISLTQPQDAITSNSDLAGIVRTQVGISLAKTFNIQGQEVDFGLTPKFSTVEAGYTNFDIADELDDTIQSSASDDFENSKIEETTMSFDFGASMQLADKPLRIAAVVRNVMPESVVVGTYEFETTPQLIVGGSYQLGPVAFSGDVALNKAKLDNLESQKLSLGVEFRKLAFALRAGIAHDSGRGDAATALSAGVGVGPLQIGARLAGSNEAQVGAQLSFGF